MLDRAYRISSDWSYFSQECDRLETVFLKLKYPRHLFNLAIKQFVDSKVADQQQIPSTDTTPAPIRVFIPFKDQVSANIIMILIIGFTCPPFEHLFQVYYKVRWSVIAKCGVITKWDSYYKKCDNFITKCDRYHKERRLLLWRQNKLKGFLVCSKKTFLRKLFSSRQRFCFALQAFK